MISRRKKIQNLYIFLSDIFCQFQRKSSFFSKHVVIKLAVSEYPKLLDPLLMHIQLNIQFILYNLLQWIYHLNNLEINKIHSTANRWHDVDTSNSLFTKLWDSPLWFPLCLICRAAKKNLHTLLVMNSNSWK